MARPEGPRAGRGGPRGARCVQWDLVNRASLSPLSHGHLLSSRRVPSLLAYATSVSPRTSAVPKSNGSRSSGGHTGLSPATGPGSRASCPTRRALAGPAGPALGPDCKVSLNSGDCHTPRLGTAPGHGWLRCSWAFRKDLEGRPRAERLWLRDKSLSPQPRSCRPPGAHGDCNRSGSARGSHPPGRGQVPLNHLPSTNRDSEGVHKR